MSKIKKYLLVTFITSWLLGGIALHDLNTGSAAGMMGFSYSVSLCMFTPTLGAILAGARFREMGWKPDIERNYKPILFAWLMPAVFSIAGAALYFLVFPEDFDASGAALNEMNPRLFKEFKESGSSYGGYIAKEIFYSIVSFQTCIAVFWGLCEEIGWRGFLYPELKEKLGRMKGVLLGGVIHGAWHFPLMIFAGYEYGNEYIGAPVLGLFAFCIFTTSTGIISDHLYEKTQSIWLPALFHGMVNSGVNPCLLRTMNHFERSIFGPADVGLISVIPIVAVAAFILYREYRVNQYAE